MSILGIKNMTSPLHLSINRELESLVIKVFPHLRREDENFRICMDFAEARVHRHTFLSPDTHKIKRALKGVAEKMAVHSKTDKAAALRRCVAQFPTIPLFRSPEDDNNQSSTTGNRQRIKSITGSAEETHYAILSFLLELSVSPQETHRQLRLAHPYARPRKEEAEVAFDWGAFLREGEEDFSVSVDTSGFLDSSDSDMMSDFDDEFDDLEAVVDVGGSKSAITTAPTTSKEDSTESSTHSSLTPQSRYPQEIYADKKWLEKNLTPEYWRGRKSSPREIIFDNPKMSSCLAAHWQRKLMLDESEGALHVDEPVPTAWLTESQGLRECLWLLRGTNLSSPIFNVKKKKSRNDGVVDDGPSISIEPNPKFCLSSLTPREWENVVDVFGRYGVIRKRIDDFIQRVFRSNNSSLPSPYSSRTYQAFAGALNQLTKEDLGFVLETLEKRLISGDLRSSSSSPVLTLTNVLNRLRPQMEMLDVIGDILAESVEQDDYEDIASLSPSSNAAKVSRLLSSMHRIIEHFDAVAPATSYRSIVGDESDIVGCTESAGAHQPRVSSSSSYSLASVASVSSASQSGAAGGSSGGGSDNFVVSAMIWLWAQSLQPIVEIVDEWLRTGQLNDPNEEFFMKRDRDIKLNDDRFWSRGYSYAASPSKVTTEASATGAAADATSSKPSNYEYEPILQRLQHPFFPPSVVKILVLAGKSMEVIQSLLKTEGGGGGVDQRRCFPLRRQFTSPLYAEFIDSLVKSNSSTGVSTAGATATTTTKKLRFASPAVENVSLVDENGDGIGSGTVAKSYNRGGTGGGGSNVKPISHLTQQPQSQQQQHSTFYNVLDSQIRNELQLTFPDPLLVINFNQTFSYDLISNISSMNEDADRFRRTVVAEKDKHTLASRLRGGRGGGAGGGVTAITASAVTSLTPDNNLHFPSFNHLLDAGLFPLLRKRSSSVCRSLVDHLLQKANLLHQLASLRAVYLLEAGDAMHTFCLEVFDQLNLRGEEVAFREGFLNSALYDALRKYHEDVADQATCYVSATSGFEDRDGTAATATSNGATTNPSSSITSLDRLKIRFDIPWPLFPLVVTTKHLDTYNLIFSSLLQVKRAKYNLDSLKLVELNIDADDVKQAVEAAKAGGRGGGSASAGHSLLKNVKGEFLTIDAIVAHMKHRVVIFRQKLLHFVNCLHNYIMLRILHVIQVDFQLKLEAAHEIENVDELRQMHEIFLQQIWERCPLNPIFGNFRNLILRLLNCCVTLQRRWRGPRTTMRAFAAAATADENYDNLDASVDSLDSLNSPPPTPASPLLSPTMVVVTEGLTPQNFGEMEHEMSQVISFSQMFLSRVIKRGSFPHLKGFALEMLPW